MVDEEALRGGAADDALMGMGQALTVKVRAQNAAGLARPWQEVGRAWLRNGMWGARGC
jgi:hypothetical protein